MAIEVKCDYCGQRYRLPDESGGKIGKCKRCGILINIPKANADGSLAEPSATIVVASADEPGGFPWRTAAIVTGATAVMIALAVGVIVVVLPSGSKPPDVAVSAAPVQGRTDPGNTPPPSAPAPPVGRQDDASPTAAGAAVPPSASPNPTPQARTGTPFYPAGRGGSRPTDTGPMPRTRLPQYGTGTSVKSSRRSPATGQSVESLIATLKANQSRRGYARFQPMDTARSRSQAADAAQELLRIGTFEALSGCVQYGDSHIRYQAIQALGQLDDSRAVGLLTACLKDPDSSIQSAAVQALRNKGPASSGPLADYLHGDSRRGAPGEPFLPRNTRGFGPIAGPTDYRERETRRQAARSLSQLHDPASRDALIACLRDDDPDIRSSGAYGLAKIGPTGVDYLIQCLADPDMGIRTCVAEALGKSGDTRAIPPLVACLADVRDKTVARALVQLGYMPATAQEKIDFYITEENAAALARMGTSVVEPLIAELRRPQPASCVVIALGQIGDPRAIDPLAATLRIEESGRVRTDVAEALWEFGDIRGVEFLVHASALGDRLQGRGEDLLASGTPRALLACLYDPDAEIRSKAISAFAKLGGRKAVAALQYALPDRELNSSLVSALSKLGWKPQSPEEEVYSWIARKDERRLIHSWPQTTKVLLADVRSGDGRKVENAVYAFIALGKSEIIQELVSVLDSSDSKETAEVYLNCGQKDLVQAAEDWAKRHGYAITRRAGRPQAEWGRW